MWDLPGPGVKPMSPALRGRFFTTGPLRKSWLLLVLKAVLLFQWYNGDMLLGLPRWLSGKEYACQRRRRRRLGFDPWVGKIPCSRKWQPAPLFLPEKFHGQRSLAGYSPWGCRGRQAWAYMHSVSTPVTVFYIRSSELIYLTAEVLYPFTNASLFPSPPETTFSVSKILTLFSFLDSICK